MEKTKLKKCKVCKTRFRPFSSLAVVCTVECAIQWGAMERQRKARRERIEYKRDNVTKPQLTKRAQAAFNKWVRLRDHDKPCISCGVFNPGGDESGGKWDCGHYRSVGSNKALRFHPLNSHKQCKRCNKSLDGNTVSYRIGLIQRIGLENVEWLEGHHETPKRSREDLIAIAKDYNQKARDLAKAVVGVVVETPLAIAADVLTLGGSLTDKAEPYTATAVKKVAQNVADATNPED